MLAFVAALGTALGAAAFGRAAVFRIAYGFAWAELLFASLYLVSGPAGTHGSAGEALQIGAMLFLMGGVPAALIAGLVCAAAAFVHRRSRDG